MSKRNKETVRTFIETIPESTGCSHGDFQTGNLIQAGEQLYWIDLDRFAYGDPMFDIGHLFLICNMYAPMKRVQDIFQKPTFVEKLFFGLYVRKLVKLYYKKL